MISSSKMSYCLHRAPSFNTPFRPHINASWVLLFVAEMSTSSNLRHLPHDPCPCNSMRHLTPAQRRRGAGLGGSCCDAKADALCPLPKRPHNLKIQIESLSIQRRTVGAFFPSSRSHSARIALFLAISIRSCMISSAGQCLRKASLVDLKARTGIAAQLPKWVD